MTHDDPEEPQTESTDAFADDGMAPLVTNTGGDEDDTADDDADAPTG